MSIPHDNTAEQSALYCMINIWEDLLYGMRELSEGCFYGTQNREVFKTLKEMYLTSEKIDIYTVGDKLRRKSDNLLLYLNDVLVNAVGINMEAYVGVLLRERKRREGMSIASDLGKGAIDDSVDFDASVNEASSRLSRMMAGESRGARDVSTLAEEFISRIGTGNNGVRMYKTGFTDYDSKFGGIPMAKLTIIAGRPAMGKSTVAKSLAVKGCLQGKRVAIFSFEMGEEEVVMGMISELSGVPFEVLRDDRIHEGVKGKVIAAAHQVAQFELKIFDNSSMKPSELRAHCLLMQQSQGLDLVVVDHIGLMRSDEAHREKREKIGSIVESLRILAKDLGNVPVVALSQLNRDVEKRHSKIPSLADLKDTSTIEESAYNVTFVYRDEYYNEATDKTNTLELVVAKNRGGKTGSTELFFHGACLSVKNITYDNVSL